jgi:hypothetical protein
MAYSLIDKLQFQASLIHQGKIQHAENHQALINWVKNEYGVIILDFCFEKNKSGSVSTKQMIHLVLETVEDVNKLKSKNQIRVEMAEKFLTDFKLNSKIATLDCLKNDIFPSDTNPFPQIIFTLRPLEKLPIEILKKMLDDEISSALEQFQTVWTISQNIIFYYTDLQLSENKTNGLSDKILELLGNLCKKYDIAPRSPHNFDSKECFDRDYQSNWYYYWK